MERLIGSALRDLDPDARQVCSCHCPTTVFIAHDDDLPEDVRCEFCGRSAWRVIVADDDDALPPLTEEDLVEILAGDVSLEDIAVAQARLASAGRAS